MKRLDFQRSARNIGIVRKKEGITLIALVVTIIVLLILAGVTIALISGENGILKRATNAVEVNEKASAQEEANLLIADFATQYYEGKYVNHKADFENIDDYIEAELRTEKETEGGYKVKYDEETGEIEVSKNDKPISSGPIVNGKVDWSEENLGEDVGGSTGGNDQNYEDYIDERIEVDQKIYINSQIGNDETGDGSQKNPYATLDKIADAGIIQNGYRYAIVLMDGEYQLTTKMFQLNCNQEINIIGNKEKTILNVGTLYGVEGNSTGGGSQAYLVNIYRLIWKGDVEGPNTIFLHTKLSLYNVVFDFNFSSAIYSYFISCGLGCYFDNCTLPQSINQFLRSWNGGVVRLTNCYGGFTSGYNTTDSMWNYRTNHITQEPQVDERYRITEDASVWKNVGTGTNPDGTQANLGVYGGEFSWDK